MDLHHEPPATPPVSGDIVQTALYCLICGHRAMDVGGAQLHYRTQHTDNPADVPMNGMEYVSGAQYLLMKIRRDAWIEQRAAEFARQLHPDFGADDFIAEAEIRDG